MEDLTIGELATRSGVTPRTIRYYVELGLLPPPYGAGRAAGYGPEHVGRLETIKRLQLARLSLEEIREQLSSMPAETQQFLAASAVQLGSASDYLATLRDQVPTRAASESPTPYTATPPPQQRGDAYVGEPWTRIPLSEDVELHVRRRGSRTDKRIYRIVKAAQQILHEEETR